MQTPYAVSDTRAEFVKLVLSALLLVGSIISVVFGYFHATDAMSDKALELVAALLFMAGVLGTLIGFMATFWYAISYSVLWDHSTSQGLRTWRWYSKIK